MCIADHRTNWFCGRVEGAVVVIGMGQLGTTLAEGFLKTGVPVVPVLRSQSISDTVSDLKGAHAVLLAMGEDDLPGALEQVPPSHLDRVILLQNELRPDAWRERYPLDLAPSVLIIWFEKKGDRAPHVVLPSIFHPEGRLKDEPERVSHAFQMLNIPLRQSYNREDFHQQLVIKNLYILALNLVGLKVGGTAGQLLSAHRRALDVVLDELLLIESKLFEGAGYPRMSENHDLLRSGLEAAIVADENHTLRGRTASRRLERTLSRATELGLNVPHLRSLRNFLQ